MPPSAGSGTHQVRVQRPTAAHCGTLKSSPTQEPTATLDVHIDHKLGRLITQARHEDESAPPAACSLRARCSLRRWARDVPTSLPFSIYPPGSENRPGGWRGPPVRTQPATLTRARDYTLAYLSLRHDGRSHAASNTVAGA